MKTDESFLIFAVQTRVGENNQKDKCNKAGPALGSKLNSQTAEVESFLEAYLP